MSGMSSDSLWATHYKDLCQHKSTSPAPEIFFRLCVSGLLLSRDYLKYSLMLAPGNITGQMQHSVIYDVVSFITGRFGTEQVI